MASPSPNSLWQVAHCFVNSSRPATGLPLPARRSLLSRRHLGQFFLRRPRPDIAPVLADEVVQGPILVQGDHSKLLHRHVLGGQTPGVDHQEVRPGPGLTAQQHHTRARSQSRSHLRIALQQRDGDLLAIKTLEGAKRRKLDLLCAPPPSSFSSGATQSGLPMSASASSSATRVVTATFGSMARARARSKAPADPGGQTGGSASRRLWYRSKGRRAAGPALAAHSPRRRGVARAAC